MTKIQSKHNIDENSKTKHDSLIKKIEDVSSLDEFLNLVKSNKLKINTTENVKDFIFVKKLNDNYLLLKKLNTEKRSNDSSKPSYNDGWHNTAHGRIKNVYHDLGTVSYWTNYLVVKLDKSAKNLETSVYTGHYDLQTRVDEIEPAGLYDC
ncbi:hypothetical protein HY837_02955 [archaeon]|nr:hypothetical protein [archaeon]